MSYVLCCSPSITPSRSASQNFQANSRARFALGHSFLRNSSSPEICHSRYSLRMQPICPSAAGRKSHCLMSERHHRAKRHAVVAAHFVEKVGLAHGALEFGKQKCQRLLVVPDVRTVHPAVVLVVAAAFEGEELFACKEHAGVAAKDRGLAGHGFDHIWRQRARQHRLGKQARLLFEFRQAMDRVRGSFPGVLEIECRSSSLRILPFSLSSSSCQ